MPALSPKDCLSRLRVLFRDAHKANALDDHQVLDWADHPDLWATHQIAHRGWSYNAAEAVVRQCRSLRKRARIALEAQQ